MSGTSSRYQAFVDEVRQRTDLVDLIASDGHKIEQSGSYARCLSPFRKERTASFTIYPDGGWYDFGTSEGGDCFSYVERRDKVDFKQAVATLAQRVGLEPYWKQRESDEISPENLAEMRSLIERRGVQDRLTEAAAYFHRCLPSRLRGNVYKKIYGFTDETIDRLKLGFDDGSLAAYFLEELEYAKETCLRTGLFIRRQESLKNFFEDRLVIPYWKNGSVVYAIGRRTEFTGTEEWDKAKYKKLLTNNDKHPYVSSCVSNEWFYNEDCCSKKIKLLIITEGVTDCIAAIQYGYNCISPVTVRFRKKDLAKLIRLCKQAELVILCNDADVLADGRKPGEEGALATAVALYRENIDVRIITLPRPEGVTKIDLCEFLRDNGKEPFDKLIEEAPRYPEFLLRQVPEGLEPIELEKQLEPLFELIASCPPIAQEQYVKVIQEQFRLSKKTIAKKLGAYKKGIEETEEETKKTKDKPNGASRPSKSSDRVRGEVIDDAFFYYVKTPAGVEERISSFVLRPTLRLDLSGQELLRCDIECMSGRTIKDVIIPRRAWRSARDFREFFNGWPDAQWTGGDDHVQGVLSLISGADVRTEQGTTNLGYYEGKNGPRWVWPDNTLSPDGLMENPDIRYCGESSLAARLDYEMTPREELVALAKEALPLLLKINKYEIVIPILAWFFSTPFKPRVQKIAGHFSILNVWGSQGCGKTSILRSVFWPLLGISKQTEPFSCTDTRFSMVNNLSDSDSIPKVLDEYKPRDMGKNQTDMVNRTLRRTYGGETEQRGRPDLKLVSYLLNAPVAFAGESTPTDSALGERIICVNPSKNTLSKQEYQAPFRALRKLPLQKMALPFIQWSLRQDVGKLYEEATDITEKTLKTMRVSVSDPRRIDNLILVIFGTLVFNAWAASVDVNLKIVVDPKMGEFKNVFTSLLSGGDNDGADGGASKDSFDRFLEQMSIYEHKGLLREGVEFVIMEGGKLRLHLPSCYDLYLAEQKRSGRDDETNGLRALQRLAKEKAEQPDTYISDASKRTDMKRGVDDKSERLQQRCVEIDQERIPDWLEVKRFKSKTIRTYEVADRAQPN